MTAAGALERHKFTERARLAVLFARRSARERGMEVTPELILYGLLLEEEGTAAELLVNHGMSAGQVGEALPPSLGPDPGSESGGPEFEAAAEEVLERAAHEARWAGREYAATEHLLLGLLHEAAGTALRLLLDAGVTEAGIRAELAARRR